MRAVIYARYSSDKQSEQSIEGQLRVCEDYCKSNNMTVVDTYCDRAISGRSDDRPAFQRMIADSANGLFDFVVVYKTDRFARNKYDSAVYKRELRRNRVDIKYAAEAIPEGPEGIILESLMEGLAEYYSAELAQKVKRGMRETAMKGKSFGPLPPGYCAAENGDIVIDPTTGPLVPQVFQRYLEGASYRDLTEWLFEMGVKTKTGRPVSIGLVSRMLRNERYIGTYIYGEIRTPNAIPALVDIETFFAVKDMLDSRKRKGNPKSAKTNYLLAGKLTCGLCGGSMVGVSGTSKNGEKHYYYYCSNARKRGQKCTKSHERKQSIEEFVAYEVSDFLSESGRIQELAAKLTKIQDDESDKAEKVSYFESRISDTKKNIRSLISILEAGTHSQSLLNRLQELEEEQHRLKIELESLKHQKFGFSYDEIVFALEQLSHEGLVKLDSSEKIERLIDAFVAEVDAYEDHLVIYYNIAADNPPSDELKKSVAEFDQRSDWYPNENADRTYMIYPLGIVLSCRR